MERETKRQRTERMAKQYAEAARIVASGKCPQCGSPIVANITIGGWYQCAAYGAPGFRGRFDGTGRAHPEFDALPACSFQVFTR